MKLTPLDIRHKDFKRGMRGYVDGEVDEFLDEVADEFERLFKENIELSEHCDTLQEKIAQYRNLEETLQNTLVAAQRSAEELKANAQKEAQLILSEAELKARQMVNDSYADKQGIEKQIVVLKSSEEDFRFKFRSLLEGYLKQIVDLDKAVRGADFAGKADELKKAMAADQARHTDAPPRPPAPAQVAPVAAAAPSTAPTQVPPAARDERPAAAPAPAPRPDAAGEPRREPAVDEGRAPLLGDPDDLLADVESEVDDNEFKW